MLKRLFVIVITVIALAVGVLALVLPREQLVRLIIFRDFFDVTLPILAFGALVKYLFTCCFAGCPKCKPETGCGMGCDCGPNCQCGPNCKCGPNCACGPRCACKN